MHPDPETELSPPSAREVAEVLVESHRRFLAFVERRVGDRAVAEDLLQSAFVRGLERIDQVRDSESIVAWFYRVLRNAVTDHHRRQASRARGLDGFARELEAHPDAPLPDDEAELCACLSALVDTLPADQALAVRRVDLEGMAVKDYAQSSGITANNAGVRLFRARERLRKAVARSCGTCATHGCVDCTCGPAKHDP